MKVDPGPRSVSICARGSQKTREDPNSRKITEKKQHKDVLLGILASLDDFCVLIGCSLGFCLCKQSFKKSRIGLAFILCAAVMEPSLQRMERRLVSDHCYEEALSMFSVQGTAHDGGTRIKLSVRVQLTPARNPHCPIDGQSKRNETRARSHTSPRNAGGIPLRMYLFTNKE